MTNAMEKSSLTLINTYTEQLNKQTDKGERERQENCAAVKGKAY